MSYTVIWSLMILLSVAHLSDVCNTFLNNIDKIWTWYRGLVERERERERERTCLVMMSTLCNLHEMSPNSSIMVPSEIDYKSTSARQIQWLVAIATKSFLQKPYKFCFLFVRLLTEQNTGKRMNILCLSVCLFVRC